jgi:hypothetical protein
MLLIKALNKRFQNIFCSANKCSQSSQHAKNELVDPAVEVRISDDEGG